MVDTTTNTLTTLYVINHLAWQREGQLSLDRQRALLLDVLAQIVDELSASSSSNQAILLGGETIIFSDTARVSQSLMISLVKYAQENILATGPWYVYLDGLLASGEAFIRSLLLGRADTQQYGIPQGTVAIMPKNYQSSQQLPQLLKSFGIDAVFMHTDARTIPLPFNWQAPDGSQVLVMPYHAAETTEKALTGQREFQPDGPFLWVHQTEQGNIIAAQAIGEAVDMPLSHTTLADYAAAVRERLPDAFRPVLANVLHMKSISDQSGRFSARMSLKTDILRLEAKLVRFVEPLLALALNFGVMSFPDIQKSLLNHSWQSLLQNMTPTSFAGAVNDSTVTEMKLRNRTVEDNTYSIIEKSIQSLSGQSLTGEPVVSDETYLIVWNPHGYEIRQLVGLTLSLPTGMHPNVLIAPDGEEQPFTWDSKRQFIDFQATVPSAGYAVYTLKISKEKTAEYNQNRAVAGRSIGTASGVSLGLVGGRLDWTFANGSIMDLLSYYDGGDAGDIWQYVEPTPDVVMKGSIVDVIQVEATPTYERLLFRNRMRIAPQLKDGKERVRGLRVLDLTTTATYHNGLPGVHFQTQFTNTAEDHRLRVHLRTGINADHIYTDTTFGLSKHSIHTEPVGDLPMQTTAVISDDERAIGLFTRGLLAVEPIREDNQITLALTLLRAVGMLDKEQGITAAGAQMPGDFTTEFMLMPLDANPNQADLVRQSLVYQAPLMAVQYSEKSTTVSHSYLTIESDHVVMTALKPPHERDGLLIRLRNTHNESSTVKIIPNKAIQKALKLSLAEQEQETLTVEANQLALTLDGGQILTILLEF